VEVTWEVYGIGSDPGWAHTGNKLNFVNSFKMKFAIIVGVIQMVCGVCTKLMNCLYFKVCGVLVCVCIHLSVSLCLSLLTICICMYIYIYIIHTLTHTYTHRTTSPSNGCTYPR
jgi:V-type H+-transporting ATPase subunit a